MTTYHIRKDTAGFVKGISKNGTDLKEGFIRKELMNKEYSEMKGIVIAKGEKYYTNLEKTFKLLGNIQKNYNWLITAYECYPQKMKNIKLLSGEWCWISGVELTKIIESEEFQWIWGVLSAFPLDVKKEDVLQYQLPTADNEEIWKNPVSIQHPLAVLEIIAWDSVLTVITSKEDDVVEKIRKSNPLIEDLEEYNNRQP